MAPNRGLRACASLTALVLAVSLFANLPALGQADSATSAAGWISQELSAPEPSFDVFGKTAARNDVIYALAGAGGHEGAVRRGLSELQTGAAEYVGQQGSTDTGALAKVLLSIEITHESPSDFIPGRDLEAELRESMGSDGMFAADVFNQSLAVIALGTTPSGVPDEAATALAQLQCDSGEFTFDGTCPATAPDVDSTALATQALLGAGRGSAAARAARWMAGVQNADGSFPNPYGEPNANTAGIAGQSLRATGELEAADLAANFVISLQLPDGGIRFLESDNVANGFATLQGILALGAPPYFALSVPPYSDVAWSDTFAQAIDWLGDSGITAGCDGDGNRYCPDQPVTRGQMAAFLTRALHLTGNDPNPFTDTSTSIFTNDIAHIAAAGITKGCNPPQNDRYCPDQPVTRGQMAAFLTRALHLTGNDPNPFTDTSTSIFTNDIAHIAAAGITKGCNPPQNDRYCPDQPVTRGQMAAFLFRAEGP